MTKNKANSRKLPARVAIALASCLVLPTLTYGDALMIDLTHPLGTFNPTDGDLTQPDLSSPHGDSVAIPTFGNQAVYEILPDFPTNQGHFVIGRLLVYEHHGTHMDSSYHYLNNEGTKEPEPRRKLMHEMTADDLIGPAVVIDIGSRVQTELDKNGGNPSPDAGVTDFGDDSPNVIMPEDVDVVADQIDDGVWVVANVGWSRFYKDANWETTPYFNGWNFPGFNAAAIDRLIEIEDKKGVRINGIVIDNIGVDSGQSSKGTDDKWSNSFHSHVRGLQRGWKFVENATNLDQVAMAKDCTIVVGAPKHVGGAGGPSRVLAMCQK